MTQNDLKRSLIWSTSVVMVVTLIGYILSLISQMLIAYYFGASKEVDAFVAAKIIPDIFFGIATVLFTTVFVIVFSKIKDTKEKALCIIQKSTTLALVGGVVSAAVLMVLAPYAARIVGPGFDVERIILTTQLIRIVAVGIIFLALTSLFTGVLYSYHRFFVPTLLKVFIPLGIVIGIILMQKSVGVMSLALGMVAGIIVAMIVQLVAVYKEGFRYTWVFDLKDIFFLDVMKLSWPLLISSIFFYITRAVNNIFASWLPMGTVAVLNYAFALVLVPVTLFSQSITTTTYPLLTSFHTQNDHASFREMFSRKMKWIVFVLVPLSCIFIFFGDVLITFFFERGAFSAANSAEVGSALLFYSIGMVAMGLQAGMFNVLHAQKKVKQVMWLMGLLLVSNVVFNALLIGPMSYKGLALSMSLAYWVNVAVGWWMVRKI